MKAGDHIFLLLAKMSNQVDNYNTLCHLSGSELSSAFNEENNIQKEEIVEDKTFEEVLQEEQKSNEREEILDNLRKLSNPIAYSPELVLANSKRVLTNN